MRPSSDQDFVRSLAIAPIVTEVQPPMLAQDHEDICVRAMEYALHKVPVEVGLPFLLFIRFPAVARSTPAQTSVQCARNLLDFSLPG